MWMAACLAAVVACNEKPPSQDSPAPAVSAPVPTVSAPTANSAAPLPPPPGGIKNVPSEGTLSVDLAESKLGWSDKEAAESAGAHFEKYEASLVLANGKPTSLSLTFQSASLTVKDKPDLARRVKAGSLDAFGNAKGSFVSTSIKPTATPNQYEVEGELTFRMTKKPASFTITVETRGTGFHVTGQYQFFGANFGAEGKLGLHLDLVFPFPN